MLTLKKGKKNIWDRKVIIRAELLKAFLVLILIISRYNFYSWVQWDIADSVWKQKFSFELKLIWNYVFVPWKFKTLLQMTILKSRFWFNYLNILSAYIMCVVGVRRCVSNIFKSLLQRNYPKRVERKVVQVQVRKERK